MTDARSNTGRLMNDEASAAISMVEHAYLDCAMICEKLSSGARDGLADAGAREAEMARVILAQLASAFREKAQVFKTRFSSMGEA